MIKNSFVNFNLQRYSISNVHCHSTLNQSYCYLKVTYHLIMLQFILSPANRHSHGFQLQVAVNIATKVNMAIAEIVSPQETMLVYRV